MHNTNDNSYVASWLQNKVATNPIVKPTKQTDEQRYLSALYHCGEASI